jgi:RNA polymerase sigma-32 factor
MSLAVVSENNLDYSFSRYLAEARSFPILEAEDEYMLAKRVQLYQDPESANKLITSHLRLVAKLAFQLRGYGMALMDLVAEGHIGLMHAVKKFDPDKGFRFSTYAMWWIKASMQEFIIKSWSIVKIGTTAAQKKLFFNLGKIKKKIANITGRNFLDNDDIQSTAMQLDVSYEEVKEMDSRLSNDDFSLDAPISNSNEEEICALDLIEESRPNQEYLMIENDEYSSRKKKLAHALAQLNERERDVIASRHLSESPLTLEDLSKKYAISKERIRQIESRAFEKIKSICTEIVAG